MPDPLGTPRPHRARAIAELPLEPLLAEADELAREWAVALILARPPGRIGEVPLERLARRAPALCAQALRAVRSDAELERAVGHAGDGTRGHSPACRAEELAAICGADDAATLARCAEALRGVLYEALLDAAFVRSPRQVAELADRLAYVCSELLAAALGAMPLASTAAPAPPASPPGAAAPGAALPADAAPRLLDEREAADVSGPAPHVAPSRGERRGGGMAIVDERDGVWGQPAAGPAAAVHGEIEIRDQRRGEEGPAAWVSSIGAQLERFERDGSPFAVLLVEPVELERMRREDGDEALRRVAGQIEEALRAQLGAWSGSLTRERPGRYWLVVPATDARGAERLAGRLHAGVGSLVRRRGAPVALAIGTAVCPEDGRQAAALAAHADVGLYAARAAARMPVTRPPAPADRPVS